ncbi:MAG: ABC transporter ATP-binding protein [Flavobacteriaceae bacterium]
MFGGIKALTDVNISLMSGEWLGIIGPNGSGKTTFLNVLSGVYRPSSGHVAVAGKNINALAPSKRGMHGIVRTFQHPQLAGSLTILENIMIGQRLSAGGDRINEAQLRKRALAAAEQFGCAAHCHQLPDEAPYGVRKIAEIARASIAHAKILLLDEPAAGLSQDERSELKEALRTFAKHQPETGVFLIEHDVSFVAALCQNIVVLTSGAVLASGPTEAILADEAVKLAYLGRSGGKKGDGARV